MDKWNWVFFLLAGIIVIVLILYIKDEHASDGHTE